MITLDRYILKGSITLIIQGFVASFGCTRLYYPLLGGVAAQPFYDTGGVCINETIVFYCFTLSKAFL